MPKLLVGATEVEAGPSGAAGDGTNDLTVTTDGSAAVGDMVVIRGVLTVDKDFGAGYNYAAIIEKAAVTIE